MSLKDRYLKQNRFFFLSAEFLLLFCKFTHLNSLLGPGCYMIIDSATDNTTIESFLKVNSLKILMRFNHKNLQHAPKIIK